MGRPRQPLAPEMQVDVAQLRHGLAQALAALGCPLDARGELPGVCAGAGPAEHDGLERLVERVVREALGR
jgi:hypothetical protein